MPYIRKEYRKPIDVVLSNITHHLDTSGDLNYAITRLILNYVEKSGECYAIYNSIIGALESVKAEFYRRKVAPYEEQKRKENGDVF